MNKIELLDSLWKPVKAFIYRIICAADYARYLRFKATLIIFLSSIGLYEKQHLDMLGTFVKRGDCAIDVGAHYGIYAEALRKLVSTEGAIVAIEPLPEVFDILQNRLKQFSNIECLNCAASDGSVSHLQLAVPSLAGGVPEPALASHHGSQESIYKVYSVPCKRLDDIEMKGKIAFIKIDVESHEAEVIRGASKLISAHRPAIQVEISKSSFELVSSNTPFGLNAYKVASLNNSELITLSKIDKEGIYYLLPF